MSRAKRLARTRRMQRRRRHERAELAWLRACAKDCRGCGLCQEVPCGGCMQGGWCDYRRGEPCNCDSPFNDMDDLNDYGFEADHDFDAAEYDDARGGWL